MAEPIYLHAWTNQAIPVQRVLDGAKLCTEVLVLGWTEDGTLYAASSEPDSAAVLWLIETFKHKMFAGDYR